MKLTSGIRKPVLHPGGVNSVGVPDGEMVLRHYTSRDYAARAV
jgi:hypothetical protein